MVDHAKVAGVWVLAAFSIALIMSQKRRAQKRASSTETPVLDWRVWKAATVGTVKGPPGATVKPGDVMYAVSVMRDSALGKVSFITPSPVALALDIAIRSAKAAKTIRSQIRWTRPDRDGIRWAETEDIHRLYRYFADSMIAVSFSFQALEAFANQVIVMSLQGTMEVERRKEMVQWTAGDIERKCTTEEKLATILPTLSRIASPKGTKLWERFVELKAMRDGTMHLKELNQYVRGTEDQQTLYYHFLNSDPKRHPQHAMEMIRYFTLPGRDAWLRAAEDQLREEGGASAI